MRVGLVQTLRQDAAAGTSESALWSATDTTHLHGWLQQLLAQQRTAEAAAVRQSPPVLENLPHALAHLRLARGLCPLLPDVHLLLAQLTVLEPSYADNQKDLQRVRLTARGNPWNPDAVRVAGTASRTHFLSVRNLADEFGAV